MQSLSREELYERVWAEPMTKVAAEFGVSGTALKKTCDRHDVGYVLLGAIIERLSPLSSPSL